MDLVVSLAVLPVLICLRPNFGEGIVLENHNTFVLAHSQSTISFTLFDGFHFVNDDDNNIYDCSEDLPPTMIAMSRFSIRRYMVNWKKIGHNLKPVIFGLHLIKSPGNQDEGVGELV